MGSAIQHENRSNSPVRSHRSHQLSQEELPDIEQELTDSDEEDEFIRRFGDINFQ